VYSLLYEGENVMKYVSRLLLSFVFVIPCLAATITVDDDGPADFNNIQAAIDAAAAGDTIVVADGTYTGLGNRDIDPCSKAITVRAENGPANCIIDCQHAGRGFYCHSGEDSNTVIEGFTVVDGNAPLDEGGVPRGGGIYCESSSPQITDCVIVSCSALHTEIVEIFPGFYEVSHYGRGGGIYCAGPNNPRILGCTVSGNEAVTGAGVHLQQGSEAVLIGCDINNNTAKSGGGGIFSSGSNPIIEDCQITNNVTVGGSLPWGGGILCDGGSASIKRCVISQNTAGGSGRGGGMSFRGNCSPEVINSLIINNSAPLGEYGGGISCENAIPEIKNCTFSGNTAGRGGAIDLISATATITNCILWNDSPSEIAMTATGHAAVTYSNVQDGCAGVGNIDANPLFASGDDFRLVFGSLCIDAGTNSPPGGLPTTDLDGIARPFDGDYDGNSVADMGAYEFHQNPGEPVLAITPSKLKFTCPVGGPNPEHRVLSIWNAGGGLLRWEIDEDCNWLDVTPSSGQSEGEVDEVTVTVDANGLAPDKYDYFLIVWDPCGGPNIRSLAVSFRVGPTLYVPADFNTIQDAVDAAFDGDVVVVSNGTYTGVGNKDIDYKGKAITVRSENGPDNCIIDCENSGRGFYFHSCEDADSIVDGFTITNGYCSELPLPEGGGIFCLDACTNPTIRNCIVTGNRAYSGGGISCYRASATIMNCTISNNEAYYDKGGGILCWEQSNATITGCTIADNQAEYSGGGTYFYGGSHTLSNCILWGNSPSQITRSSSSLSLSYCDVQGGWSGVGNINADPCFAGVQDYHLGPNSPCVNAGDPDYSPAPEERDIDGGPRVMDDRVEIGSDEVSSMPADFDEDGTVSADDLDLLSQTWLNASGDQGWDEGCDLNLDMSVDLGDYALFARDWSKQSDAEPPTVPSSLAATNVTATTITLVWDISTDNVRVAGYKVYRDGYYVGWTHSTNFTDSELEPQTTYTYAVCAYDAAYNESALCDRCQAATAE
jgi:parallel beta-helix repeat protein